ncbi:MAG TPA: carboxylesterase family protein, partial [bacterium]|nr:carboxylesterase family protein [bacterium]
MRTRENFGRAFVIGTFCAALVFFGSAAFADGPADCSNIQTDKGKVTGKADAKNGICVYKGIPFAAPPVGELRFALPEEHEPWGETLSATK